MAISWSFLGAVFPKKRACSSAYQNSLNFHWYQWVFPEHDQVWMANIMISLILIGIISTIFIQKWFYHVNWKECGASFQWWKSEATGNVEKEVTVHRRSRFGLPWISSCTRLHGSKPNRNQWVSLLNRQPQHFTNTKLLPDFPPKRCWSFSYCLKLC